MKWIIIFLIGLFLITAPGYGQSKADTTISVIVGGFNPDGSTKTGPFGVARTQDLITKASKMLGVPDGTVDPYAPNQIVQVEYYGDQAPKYYKSKDMGQIEAAGKGTPRYALIAAKFIKHRMALTGATKVNLAGGSYGGLISRYIIEHDVEGLASSGKIVRWLSLEGVVGGAYPANLTEDDELRKFVVEVLGLDLSDPLTMNYSWITKNINDPRNETKCPYFKNILIGHHISSNDDLNMQALTLAANKANDGVLLVEDQQFQNVAPESRFHGKMPLVVHTNTTHMSAKKDPTFLLNIVNFVRGDKRVTIKLTQGKAIEFKEEEWLLGPGEIVFQGKVFSPHAVANHNIAKEVGILSRKFHTAQPVQFKAGETKALDACLFDWLVDPNEKTLKLSLSAEEIDWDDVFKIEEDILEPVEDLGSAELEIPVTEVGKKIYQVKTAKWELTLEVEVYDYNQ